MDPENDNFSFISITTIWTVSWRENNTAADNVANFLILHCVLDGQLKDIAYKDEPKNKISTGKNVKCCQTRRRS